MRSKPTFRKKPEREIQDAIIKMLILKGWYCIETHGNLYQSGLPDIFATHSRYSYRWIEVKNPLSYKFTPAQIETFPKLCANGSAVWILTSASEDQYKRLFLPPNWAFYLK